MLKTRYFDLASTCTVCLEGEESVNHLFVYCHPVFSLRILSLSFIRFSWFQSSNIKDVLVAWRRRSKELGSYNLETGSFDYLVVYREREALTYFLGQSAIALGFQAIF